MIRSARYLRYVGTLERRVGAMIEINFRLSLFFHIPLYFPDIRPNQFGVFWNNLLFAQIVFYFIVGNNFFVLIV
jgi:hypothetical protein